MRKCVIRLTVSAQRYAVRHNLEEELAKLELDRRNLVGDIVSLETSDRPHDFIIIARRCIISSDSKRLELMLDHPARRTRP
jgi:hypothetical protein